MTDHADTIRSEAVHASPWSVRDDDGRAYIVGPKSGPGWYDNVADDVSNHETAAWIVKCVNERDALLAERQQAIDERDEALRRMDEALAKQYNANAAYEAKIQDLAQETLRNSELRARCEQAIDALRFYADPNTYFGIAMLPDPPCGELTDDFEELSGELGHPDGGSWVKPGKRARAALLSLGEQEQQ